MSEDAGAKTHSIGTYLDDGSMPRDVEALEARIALLVSFVGGILFEVDVEGRYLAVWTGEPHLLLRPVEELRGRTVKEMMGTELGAQFIATFQNVLRTGTPQLIEYMLDVPAGRRNFRCETRRTPRRADGTEPQSLTLLVRDITEEVELKAKLVEAERLAAMGLVAASIGHEIRQPLAFATTSVEVLARELGASGPATPRATEALDHVRDAIQRIGGIAASAGVVAPDRPRDATTDVRRPIDAALDLCASELQGRAKLVVHVPALPRVRLNEGELCQVVANLLLNAAHAVDPERSPANRIGVSASLSEDGTKVRIAVEDDGHGIDPAHVVRVFDPFFSTKAPGRGTGLGLFVSKRIVEAAGGALEISSRLGEGTAVVVTVPVSTAESAPPSIEPVASPERLTVLVVDDEPAFLRSLELVLEDTHDVVVCARSPDALALVRADPSRFDAILCDLSMPEIDGVAFYGHVETLGLARRFVLMTAGAFTPHGDAFIRQARCRRIAKPFTLEKLLAVLSAVTAR
ncbi:MAG: response regulator [Labilithrix sp.]|nr:response regulator [Labilithrix sp.]